MAPYKEYITEKVYWTIGEVANDYNVATSLLRYWEDEFEELSPKKNRRGNRQYTKDDRLLIARLYYLIKTRGYTLWGARQILNEQHEKDNSN